MAVLAQEPSCSRQPLSPLRGRPRNHSTALEGPQSPLQGPLPEFRGAQPLGRLGLCWGCVGRAQLCLQGRHGAEGAGADRPLHCQAHHSGLFGEETSTPEVLLWCAEPGAFPCACGAFLRCKWGSGEAGQGSETQGRNRRAPTGGQAAS